MVLLTDTGTRDRTPGRRNAKETERRGDRTPSDRMPWRPNAKQTECQVGLNAKQTECQGDMNAKYTYIMLWIMTSKFSLGIHLVKKHMIINYHKLS